MAPWVPYLVAAVVLWIGACALILAFFAGCKEEEDETMSEFFRVTDRSCSTCAHWGMITLTDDAGVPHCFDGPNAAPIDGVVVRTCGNPIPFGGRRINGIHWCRGSDSCSKWRRA